MDPLAAAQGTRTCQCERADHRQRRGGRQRVREPNGSRAAAEGKSSHIGRRLLLCGAHRMFLANVAGAFPEVAERLSHVSPLERTRPVRTNA